MNIDDLVIFDSATRRRIVGEMKKRGHEWIACESGFLDHMEGVPISDTLALSLFLESETNHPYHNIQEALEKIFVK